MKRPSCTRQISIERMAKALPVAGYPRKLHRATPTGAGFGSSRYSSPTDSFRVLYAADNFSTAFAEAVVRDRFEGKPRRYLYRPHLEQVCLTAISSSRDLTLLDLRGPAADAGSAKGIPVSLRRREAVWDVDRADREGDACDLRRTRVPGAAIDGQTVDAYREMISDYRKRSVDLAPQSYPSLSEISPFYSPSLPLDCFERS